MNKLIKTLNFILLFFALGSCLFLISIINTKDIYIEILENSIIDNKETYLALAEIFFNTPMFVFFITVFTGLTFKEFYLKALPTKLKINFVAALLLLLLNIAYIFVINSPTL
ncbi:MAG: hypothetical protein K6L75_09345 [Cellvibrionaceae bacterium]